MGGKNPELKKVSKVTSQLKGYVNYVNCELHLMPLEEKKYWHTVVVLLCLPCKKHVLGAWVA